jgi:drug/metabolite transporter (DMT)-like permease
VSSLQLAVAAMLLFGLGDLIYKRGAAAGAPAHQFLMVQTWVFLPTVIVYALVTGSLRFVPASLWGVLAGLFILVGFYNFAASLRSGSISINAPVFRLSLVVTAGLAIILLGEPLTVFKIAGIGLALLAAWLLLGGPTAGQHESRESLLRIFIATLAVGIGNLIYGIGLRDGATPGSLMVVQAGVVCPIATLFAAALDRRIAPSRAALRNAPMAAVALALASVAMVESMARGEASIAVPIAQMGFVVTALLGFLFLREHFTARKGAGIAAAIGALACLAHG